MFFCSPRNRCLRTHRLSQQNPTRRQKNQSCTRGTVPHNSLRSTILSWFNQLLCQIHPSVQLTNVSTLTTHQGRQPIQVEQRARTSIPKSETRPHQLSSASPLLPGRKIKSSGRRFTVGSWSSSTARGEAKQHGVLPRLLRPLLSRARHLVQSPYKTFNKLHFTMKS